MSTVKVWARIGVEITMEVGSPHGFGDIKNNFQDTLNKMKLPKNVSFTGESYIAENQIISVDQNEQINHEEIYLNIENPTE